MAEDSAKRNKLLPELVRMLNSRDQYWIKSNDRLSAIALGKNLERHGKVLSSMINDNANSWAITAERMSAIHALISRMSEIPSSRIDDLILTVSVGSVNDKVNGKRWVQDVLDFLSHLKESEPVAKNE